MQKTLSVVLLLFTSLLAHAQLNTVWLADPRTGFGSVTAATNATPIRITVNDIALMRHREYIMGEWVTSPIENGDTILVDGVIGNLAANNHCVDSSCVHQVYTVSGLSGNSFDLLDMLGNPVAGTGTWTRGGRVHLAAAHTVKLGPIGPMDGTGGPITTLVSLTNAVAGNPAYTSTMTKAATYVSNYGSKWGYDGLVPAGTAGGVYGEMTATGALLWLTSSALGSPNTAARDMVKWSFDEGFDQLWGPSVCDETDINCRLPASGVLDYGAQYNISPRLMAYNIIKGELSAPVKANYIEFLLSDLPWTTAGGTNFTGVSLVKDVFTKAYTTSDGTITYGVGKDVVISGTGTHFTINGCAVGGFIVGQDIYDRWMKISSITDDDTLTVEVAADDQGRTNSNYACANRWNNTKYGWLWNMKHFLYATLAGGWEQLAPVTPLTAVYGSAGSYPPLGGNADDGYNNHSHTRTMSLFKVGVSTCADNIRGCLIASKADQYFIDNTLPYFFMTVTPFPWNGNTYTGGRVLGPIAEWALWRINSINGAADPFADTDVWDWLASWWSWSNVPLEVFNPSSIKANVLIPHGDYATVAPQVGGNWTASLVAMARDWTTTAVRNLYDFMTTKPWYEGQYSYVVGSPAASGSYEQYLYWRPDTSSLATTDTTYMFNEPAQDQCVAVFGLFRCTAVDVHNIFISRTSALTLTNETIVAVEFEGIACRDHCGDAAGGFGYIIKNGQILSGADGAGWWGNDNSYSVAKRPYVLVGTATDTALAQSNNSMYNASGPGSYGNQYAGIPPQTWHGTNDFFQSEADTIGLYKSSANVTAMRVQFGHLKNMTQDFVFKHVWGTMSAPMPIKGVEHLWLNTCGTPASSSCVVTPNNTTKQWGIAFDRTGTNVDAAMTCRTFGISEEMNFSTETGPLNNGSYSGGPGSGFSFRFNIIPASGDVSTLEYTNICKPTASATSTLPTINYVSSSGWRTFDIQESGSLAFLAHRSGGSTATSLTFTGTGQKLFATGFAAGTYYGKNNGAAIVGCQGITVTANSQSLSCSNVGTGTIVFDQNLPGAGFVNIGGGLSIGGGGRIN